MALEREAHNLTSSRALGLAGPKIKNFDRSMIIVRTIFCRGKFSHEEEQI